MTALRFKNDTEREFWERAIMAGFVMSPAVTVQPQEKDPERPVLPPKASPADRADALTLLLRERMGTDEPEVIRTHIWGGFNDGIRCRRCGALHEPGSSESEECPR